MLHLNNCVFLIEIRSVFKEIMNHFKLKKKSLVINLLTPVRFSKSVIFFRKKVKCQTSISPDLKWFRPWFDFVGKRNVSTKYIDFQCAYVTRYHGRGKGYLQPRFGAAVTCGHQRVKLFFFKIQLNHWWFLLAAPSFPIQKRQRNMKILLNTYIF